MPANAAEVARQLSAQFLEHGNYVSVGRLSTRGATEIAAASMTDVIVGAAFEEQGFSGLAVQSVGWEKGAPNPRVFVYLAKGSGRAERTLETTAGEVQVEVRRIGKLVVRPEMASATTSRGSVFMRQGRTACGSSCAPSNEQYAGTLGALVRRIGDNRLYALSNNHVFAAGNHVPIGMPILSPSTIDTAPGLAPRAVCEHADICELRSGIPSLVQPMEDDVAIATVPQAQSLLTSWQGDENGYDTPTSVGEPAAGMVVKKFGRTTGLTTGTVEAYSDTPFPVQYKCKNFAASVWFTNVWLVRAESSREPFALQGDSGSLVITDDEEMAVGLVFAATQVGDCYMIPMSRVISRFGGLTLVAQHGV